MTRPNILGLVVAGLFVVTLPAIAGCADPPSAAVNWSRCIFFDRDFSNVDLTGAVLREAHFNRSVFTGAKLDAIDAYRSKFVSARFASASLRGARLDEADFTATDLSGASLVGAQLDRAKFYNADLRGADLRNADIRGTDFLKANLSLAHWIDGTICAEGSISQCVPAVAAQGKTAGGS